VNSIYRASRDGFETANFHAKCDNKPNTLIIIKSANGNVFGGYTKQSWEHINDYKADPKAFIFSLINKDKKPLKIKCSDNNAIYCVNQYGPIFGDGNDIFISDKSNKIRNSQSWLGRSFVHPDYALGSNEAKSFLAGSHMFQVSEIEVYTKIK